MPSELGSSIGRFGLIAAGGYAFGPVFAAAGAVLGSFLFGASGPEIEGPRLGDTSVSASTYGNVIPVAFGVQKLAGSMIWATDIIEDKNTRTEGDGTIRSSVAIVNDTTWSTIVGTWRPGRLELYVDGWSRASSTAAATSTSALFGIYRWGWGFSTSQDFNGDIALIACFASSWTPAMVRRWHADPFGFLRPWGEVPALIGSAPPGTPPSTGTGVVTFLMG